MGWRGHETTFYPGMLFRKMYCAKCGERLKLHKQSKTYKKGEKGYSSYLCGHATIGMSEVVKIEYVYICPKCQQITTYDQQLKIKKRQKQLDTYIVEYKDILDE